MTVEAQVTINGTLEAVWAVMANIEKAAEILSGVEKIEIVERPASGIRGLKWRETRLLFGKSVTVEKVVIAGAENEFFSTESKEGGFLFSTTNLIREKGDGILLLSRHTTIPQGFTAMLKSLPMVFFKCMIKKAMLQDLNAIKKAVERKSITWSNGPPETNLESWGYINRFIDSLHGDEHWSRWKPMARSIVGALEARGLAPMFRIGQSMHTIIVSTSPHFGLTQEQLRVRLEFYPDDQIVHVAYGPGRPEIEEQVPLPNALPRVLHYLQRLWSETKPEVQMPDGLKTT